MNIFSTTFSDVLNTIIAFTGDWFIGIALLTLVVKIILFPLSIKQQRALLLSQNLNEVKTILSNKFKNSSEKINSCLAEIMAKYQVNPLAALFTILIQAPVLFSLYFSLLNLGTTAGSNLVPWIISVSKPDNLHILPVIASLFQGLTVFTEQNKNVLMFILPITLGLFFLWKAPAALSVYWCVSSLISIIEKKIFSLKAFRQRYLNVVSTEEMLKCLS